MTLAELDIAIIALVLLSALIGLYRGLVKELLSLVAWVAAFVLAMYFATTLAGYLPANWGSETVRTGIGFFVLFVGSLVLASLVQWLVAQLIASTGLTGTDRLLGFLFGSARGIVICLIVLMGLREVASDTGWWQESVLRPELLALEDDVREWLGRARGMVDNVPESATKLFGEEVRTKHYY